VPWQWFEQGPTPLRELTPTWFSSSPEQLGIVPGSRWEIELAGHLADPSYLFATNDESIWSLVLSDPKAAARLCREGCLLERRLDASIIETNRYVGVFLDSLGMGMRGAWVHSGKSPPSRVMRSLRRGSP
jgi:hypothetical protein